MQLCFLCCDQGSFCLACRVAAEEAAAGGGGGSRDGGESEPFDFRRWLAAFTQGLGKTARSLGKTMAAILLLASIFYGSHFIKPLSQATVKGVRWLLRLDGAGSRRVRPCRAA